MVQEILEFYFEKKVNNLLQKLVTKDEFSKALSVKLDYSIFRDYEKMIASDRSQELKNFKYEEELFKLERKFQDYVTNEELKNQMTMKVSLNVVDEIRETFNKFKTIQHSDIETMTDKFNALKEDCENKTS